jgi:hypothetical protein
MLRTIAAVAIGYLVFAVSAVTLFAVSGQDPKAPASARFMIAGIVYGVLFAFVAGYVAAALARRKGAALVVAAIMGVIAAVSLALQPAGSAVWSSVATLLLMAPAVVVGGTVGVRAKRRV